MNVQKLYTQMLLIAFLHAAATAAIATVEVLYLRHTLQASYTMIGSVLGTAAIGYLIFAPFLKEFSKVLGRGTYLSWTSFILALATIFAANINTPAMYLISKSIILLLAPLTFTILARFIEDELKFNADTESCYAGLTLVSMMGGIVGFLLSGKLATIMYSHGYIVSMAAFLLAGFIALALPKSTQHIRNSPPLNPLERLNTCFSKKYRHITYIVLATNAYWAIRDITIPLLLIENGYGVFSVGVLFAIGAFFGVLSSFITRMLLNKNHPERVMTAALAVGGVASLILPFGGLIVI
jgi:MFS family permease